MRHFGEEIQNQNFNIYNSHEIIKQTQKYIFFLFSEEDKVPSTPSWERWQGPPHINKVKQYRQFVYSVCLDMKMNTDRLIQIIFPKTAYCSFNLQSN